jgi:hypothetical protein
MPPLRSLLPRVRKGGQATNGFKVGKKIKVILLWFNKDKNQVDLGLVERRLQRNILQSMELFPGSWNRSSFRGTALSFGKIILLTIGIIPRFVEPFLSTRASFFQ